jgi:hypothetical protein
MLNPELLLKILPVVLLVAVQVLETGGVARSQPALGQSTKSAPKMRTWQEVQRDRQAELKKIPDLVQRLKTGTEAEKRSAVSALVDLGEDALPDLIPLFKDPNPETQAIVAEIVDQIELSTKVTEALNPSPALPDNFKMPQLYAEKPAFSVDEAIRIIQRTAQVTGQASKAARATGFPAPVQIMSPEESQYRTKVRKG